MPTLPHERFPKRLAVCRHHPVFPFLDTECAEVGDGGPKVQAGRNVLIMGFCLRCDQGEHEATLCVSAGVNHCLRWDRLWRGCGCEESVGDEGLHYAALLGTGVRERERWR